MERYRGSGLHTKTLHPHFFPFPITKFQNTGDEMSDSYKWGKDNEKDAVDRRRHRAI